MHAEHTTWTNKPHYGYKYPLKLQHLYAPPPCDLNTAVAVTVVAKLTKISSVSTADTIIRAHLIT